MNQKSYLDPAIISKIKDYRLLSRLMIDGFLLGLHRGVRNAFSLDYSEHRDYYPGDPLKLVDWKLYGKTDRFFIKQFHEETNLQSWIILDSSLSMGYQGEKGKISKLQYVSYLAAGLSHLLIRQHDLVGLMLFDERVRQVLPPSSTKNQLQHILRLLSRLKPEGASNFEEVIPHIASHCKKRGMIILFSDLLASEESIEKSFKYFLGRGNELVVFHILTPEERNFPFKQFGYFQDMETKQKILLNPQFMKEEYQQKMESYLNAVKRIARKLKVNYTLLDTSTSFDSALRTFLNSRERLVA